MNGWNLVSVLISFKSLTHTNTLQTKKKHNNVSVFYHESHTLSLSPKINCCLNSLFPPVGCLRPQKFRKIYGLVLKPIIRTVK